MSDPNRPSAFDAARDGSAILAGVRRTVEKSRLVARVRTCWRNPREWIAGTPGRSSWRSSRVRRSLGGVRATLASAVATADVTRLARTTEQWIEASFFVRWLATDSGQMMVVDLRDTSTVGPVLVALDGPAGILIDGWETSITRRKCADAVDYVQDTPVRAASLLGLAAMAATLSLQVVLGGFGTLGIVLATLLSVLCVLGLRSDASWAELSETALVRYGTSILVGTAPPGRTDRDGSGTEEDDRPQTRTE